MNEKFLEIKLQDRQQANAVRTLKLTDGLIDFCSNDYLGVVKNKLLERHGNEILPHGSTGSRLLSGNYQLLEDTEDLIASFHDSAAALIFNSGYDANIGLLSCVPQRDDVIIYDYLSHASIRDGIRLSFATSFSFLHNDLEDLEKKLATASKSRKNIFVVTESVFSMDGDIAPLNGISSLCEKYNALLIVDEAHATGVIGKRGEGLVQVLGLQQKCFARLHTFGKACGCHGSAILGSLLLKKYLVNFARPFMYSTSLPPSAVQAIAASYQLFPSLNISRERLTELINIFQRGSFKYSVPHGCTPIQVVIVPGNDEVKKAAEHLQQNNFDVRPILYPTVPKGQERLRIVLHAFNTVAEVEKLISLLA